MTTDLTALTAISGPELLDQMADSEESAGSAVNAAHYRERALQWAQLERRVAELETENSTLAQRLQRIRDTAQPLSPQVVRTDQMPQRLVALLAVANRIAGYNISEATVPVSTQDIAALRSALDSRSGAAR